MDSVDKNLVGKKLFYFAFWANPSGDNLEDFEKHAKKGVEPYMVHWDGDEETLFSNPHYGCNETFTNTPFFCTAIIQHNGWKIPDNYPFKL